MDAKWHSDYSDEKAYYGRMLGLIDRCTACARCSCHWWGGGSSRPA
jgi:hypothetical protein